VIRGALSAVARNESLGGLLSRAPIARDVVKRVVGGETVESALGVAADLADRGFVVSLERAAPAVTTDAGAAEVTEEYRSLVDSVAASGLADVVEVTVFTEALGLLPDADPQAARARLRDLADHAAGRRIPLMVGMGPVDDAAMTLAMVDELHAAGLEVGITLPAALRRTEADCVRLADRRVRLVKGSRKGEASVAYAQPFEIDKAFVRCAKALLKGTGQASFATHDPRLIEIVETLVGRYGRARHSYEFALFMGRQEGAQERLLAAGERVRVYVPYGPDWFERLVGGLAEQPGTITAALRSLLPGAS
jgi:proline dehydrogenase